MSAVSAFESGEAFEDGERTTEVALAEAHLGVEMTWVAPSRSSRKPSRSRLIELARLYPTLRERGAEVLGMPLRDARRVYRALGDAPVVFPIAVDGAEDAANAYGLFRRDFSPEGQEPNPPPPPHMELLVDRQGYLRARWIPGGGTGWADPARLLATVEELAKETPRASAPEEHVH